MADFAALAELSHGLERVALALAGERVDMPLIVHELLSIAAGQREPLAIALSYLFRHRSLGTVDDDEALGGATAAVVAALRQLT